MAYESFWNGGLDKATGICLENPSFGVFHNRPTDGKDLFSLMFCNNTCTFNVRHTDPPQEQLSNSNTGCYVGCATLGGISVQEWFGGGWWATSGKKRAAVWGFLRF